MEALEMFLCFSGMVSFFAYHIFFNGRGLWYDEGNKK
jgi:hypothetical protein